MAKEGEGLIHDPKTDKPLKKYGRVQKGVDIPPPPHSKKTPDRIEAILNEISTSATISTTRACEKHDLTYTTWKEWMAKDDELAARYARAKESQAEMLADEIVQISDECMVGERTKVKSDGTTEVTTGDMVDRSKLRVDARKWVAAHLLPKKYGDKIGVEHSGEMALTVNVIDRFKSGNSD